MKHLLDPRVPIGALCIIIGAPLAGYGAAPHADRARSLALDWWWGIVMVAFGIAMLLGAWWHARRRSIEQPPREGVS
jgi:hypothetical protein